ncbi:hypothetical protein [Cylindrospermopsis raciborskii]|uniref:hypothetical protein n=1 Tax=Cylindrospermopsis raciborskii TaxID=77022 RepID=UPI0015E0A6CC|nr:hypothetical protein [Cylindrospermopsis raciborskii]
MVEICQHPARPDYPDQNLRDNQDQKISVGELSWRKWCARIVWTNKKLGSVAQ